MPSLQSIDQLMFLSGNECYLPDSWGLASLFDFEDEPSIPAYSGDNDSESDKPEILSYKKGDSSSDIEMDTNNGEVDDLKELGQFLT